ncbi:hypothetical protein J4558_19295 [Leptolyngbya sp. 15MV]|nr:hypothetical protein J4558_19295 [Leptolyngbya sp. 15MV]
MKLLTFSSLYPNAAQPNHGVFVENRLRHLLASGEAESTVLAPVPWFPGRGGPAAPAEEMRHGIPAHHPPFVAAPGLGMLTNPFALYHAAARVLDRLVAGGLRFDVIDGHYLYPDGVAAVLLARRYGKPVTLTARGSDTSQARAAMGGGLDLLGDLASHGELGLDLLAQPGAVDGGEASLDIADDVVAASGEVVGLDAGELGEAGPHGVDGLLEGRDGLVDELAPLVGGELGPALAVELPGDAARAGSCPGLPALDDFEVDGDVEGGSILGEDPAVPVEDPATLGGDPGSGDEGLLGLGAEVAALGDGEPCELGGERQGGDATGRQEDGEPCREHGGPWLGEGHGRRWCWPTDC